MRRLIGLVVIMNLLLFFLPGASYSHAAEPKQELDWDYLTSNSARRDLDTVTLHILEKASETKNRSVYRGITVTRAYGNITLDGQRHSSSAVGIGPVYLIRDERGHSGKLTTAIDLSGGVLLYDKAFPAGGRAYNFMWRIGPRFIYQFDKNSSVSVGYMFAHVSNGFRTHNPGYDSHGVSVGFVTNF